MGTGLADAVSRTPPPNTLSWTTAVKTLLSLTPARICLSFALRIPRAHVTTLRPCHVSPAWGELHVEGRLQVPISLSLWSLGPRWDTLDWGTSCAIPLTWGRASFWAQVFHNLPAPVVYKDQHSDIVIMEWSLFLTWALWKLLRACVLQIHFSIRLLGLTEYPLYPALLQGLRTLQWAGQTWPQPS